MKAFNRRLLHRAVHAFDLAVGPGVGGLGEALLDAPFVAELPEGVAAEVGVLRQVSKLYAIVGQYFVYLVGYLGQHPTQEVHGEGLRGLRVQFGEGQLARAVNGDEEVLLAFFRAHLGEIDVQVADGVVLELLFQRASRRLIRGQATDAVALQAAVQGRTAQVRNRLLERVEAVVEGQKRLSAKQDDGCFFGGREDR